MLILDMLVGSLWYTDNEHMPEQDFSVWAILVWAVSVWGHFGHNISAHKQLIACVYINDYIGRQNLTLAGGIPTPF